MSRHPQRIEPAPGQESVWDYPRPPRLEASDRLVVVSAGGRRLISTDRAFRVLETSHPPTWYLPPDEFAPDVVRPSSTPGTFCEWKGEAEYWDVIAGSTESGSATVLRAVGWSYPRPSPGFEQIAGYLSFYPALLECTIDGERVRPQEGGFYGGWVTNEIVGPFKGGPGSWGW